MEVKLLGEKRALIVSVSGELDHHIAEKIKAEVDDKKVLKSYFLEGSDTYQAIIRTTIDYVQQGSSWEFTDISVSDYCRYDENHFSVRVEMNLSETRSSGTVKDWPYGKSMIFQKQSDGNWLCILSVNFHLSEPVGRVRLTFMQDEIPVSSDFYYTDSDEIITPIISAPEGKVFAGWVQKVKDENGKTALCPGENRQSHSAAEKISANCPQCLCRRQDHTRKHHRKGSKTHRNGAQRHGERGDDSHHRGKKGAAGHGFGIGFSFHAAPPL